MAPLSDTTTVLGCVCGESVTPSPRAFVFSLENAVRKDSHRRTWGLPVLLPYSSVGIITDSVLQRKNTHTWLGVSAIHIIQPIQTVSLLSEKIAAQMWRWRPPGWWPNSRRRWRRPWRRTPPALRHAAGTPTRPTRRPRRIPPVRLAAAGQTVILMTPLVVSIETPTEGRGGCSRMTVSPTARRAGRRWRR